MSHSTFYAGGNPVMDWHPIQGGGGGNKYHLSPHVTETDDKCRAGGPLGLYANLNFCFEKCIQEFVA